MSELNITKVKTNVFTFQYQSWRFLKKDDKYSYFIPDSFESHKNCLLRIDNTSVSTVMVQKYTTNISKYIMTVMQQKGIKSQHELSRLTNGQISQMTISNILSGKTDSINTATISLLSHALGVSEEDFINNLNS